MAVSTTGDVQIGRLRHIGRWLVEAGMLMALRERAMFREPFIDLRLVRRDDPADGADLRSLFRMDVWR